MSFWDWAAQSDSIRQLPKAKRALNAIRSETTNKHEESSTEKTARLYRAVLTPEELIANPIIRAEIISNIPIHVRTSKHFEKIQILHEQIATNDPSNEQIEGLLYLFGCKRLSLQPENRKEIANTSRIQTAQYSLFSHQRDVLVKANSLLTSREKKCIIHMPTGTGKTRTAMSLIAQWLNNNRGPVVWMTYSKELILQAAEEFRKCWNCQGQFKASICFYTGDFNTFNSAQPEFDICFTSFGKAGREASGKAGSNLKNIAERTQLLVIDEAHQSMAPTYKEAIDSFIFYHNNSSLLGLTATPGRSTSNNEDENIELSQLFGHQKVTLEIENYESPIEYLLTEGYLAKPQYEIIQIPDNEQELSTRALIGIIQEAISQGHERILVFTKSVDEATLCTGLLEYHGIKSFSISAEDSLDKRSTAYREFLSDQKKAVVLCNYGVLTTGFDAPKTSCVIIARPINSLIIYSQTVGRALRGPAANGTECARIVTIVPNENKEFLDLVEAFNRWNEQWSTVK